MRIDDEIPLQNNGQPCDMKYWKNVAQQLDIKSPEDKIVLIREETYIAVTTKCLELQERLNVLEDKMRILQENNGLLKSAKKYTDQNPTGDSLDFLGIFQKYMNKK